MIQNTKNSYGLVSRLLHWSMSVLIIVLITVGLYMSDLEPSPDKWKIYAMHKSFGVMALILIAIRIINRARSVIPTLPNSLPHWQAKASKANVLILYVMMMLMPISGFFGSLFAGYPVSFFDLFAISAFEKNEFVSSLMWKIHETCPPILIICIFLHIAAGLYHHFFLKDNILTRMIKG